MLGRIRIRRGGGSSFFFYMWVFWNRVGDNFCIVCLLGVNCLIFVFYYLVVLERVGSEVVRFFGMVLFLLKGYCGIV